MAVPAVEKFQKRVERLIQKLPLKLRQEWVRYVVYGAGVAYVVVDAVTDGFQLSADVPVIVGAVVGAETLRAGVKPAHRK